MRNISYFMKFLDWKPPSAQKLHFKILGIIMGTFLGTPTQDLTCLKDSQGAKGNTYKVWQRLVKWFGLYSRQKWRYFLNNNNNNNNNNNKNNSMCSKVCRLRRRQKWTDLAQRTRLRGSILEISFFPQFFFTPAKTCLCLSNGLEYVPKLCGIEPFHHFAACDRNWYVKSEHAHFYTFWRRKNALGNAKKWNIH